METKENDVFFFQKRRETLWIFVRCLFSFSFSFPPSANPFFCESILLSSLPFFLLLLLLPPVRPLYVLFVIFHFFFWIRYIFVLLSLSPLFVPFVPLSLLTHPTPPHPHPRRSL